CRRARAGGDDRSRHPLRDPADLPGPVRAQRTHQPVGRGRRGRDGPHRTGALARPGAGGPCHCQHAGEAGAWPGRRPGQHPVPGHLGAAGGRPGDEPADVGAPGHPGQRRTAPQPGRAGTRAGGRRPGLWRGRRGADAGAGRDRGRAGRSRGLMPDTPLAGRHVLVTAGPTYEDIDPVRFLGNRSSGRMGFAVAAAAQLAGARVTLVAGPVALDAPTGTERIDVRSAAQMHEAVMAALPADIYVGAAAVADFTPAILSGHKIKKGPGDAGLVLELVRTRDILADVAAHPRRPALVVGFAAETGDLEANARGKLDA